jgi:hypothetical protein
VNLPNLSLPNLVDDLDLLLRVGAELHEDHGHGVVGLGVEQTIASGGVTARLLLVSTFCHCWRQTTTLAPLDKLAELRQDRNERGVGLSRWTRPLHHG